MALGSSRPPEIRTEGVRPEKSDTEMELVPENISILLRTENEHKSVLSVEQGLFGVGQFAVRDFLPELQDNVEYKLTVRPPV